MGLRTIIQENKSMAEFRPASGSSSQGSSEGHTQHLKALLF